ncbi:nucleotide-binding protein [Enhygromyxa salina]|nr:nucleotide-binding protein [Enhygromyxa salina]
MISCSAALLLSFGCEARDEPDDVVALECDIPQLFADRCGGSTCHGAGESTAAGLDLTTPGVEDRVSSMPGMSCVGVLANPAVPEQSLLYEKVAGAPSCGAPMPVNGDPLTEDELACMRDWISGLLPPGGGGGGGEGSETGMDTGGQETVCEAGAVEDCYSGPPETVDVGICVGGMRTCAADGTSWGACEGEVTPRGEDCLTADIDENCDGNTPACTELWSRSFGDPMSQGMRSVAVDSAGNIYSVGDFEGVVSFGAEPLAADGVKHDLVIAKHDLYGNPIWSKHFGDTSNQYASKVVVDAADNFYFLARIFGNVDFGGGKLHGEGQGDLVIAKFNPSGQHIWSRRFGDLDPDRAERMAVDGQGDLLITGSFAGSVDYGAGLFSSAGLRDAVVIKLDGDTGAHIFSRQIGGAGDDYGFGIGADQAGNVVIAGRFQESIELGGTLNSAGGMDIYVAKLEPNGALLWSESFGGSGDDGVHDLEVQPVTNNIVLTGYMSETMSFGGPDLVSAGERDIFLATLDPDGGHVWSAAYGDSTDQFTSTFEINTWLTLALGANGDIYLGGSLMGVANFGGADVSSASEKPDVFFAKLSADGSLIASNRYGGIGTDMALDIAVTATGHKILAGRSFASSIDFGVSGVVSFNGGSDGFIVKLAP